MENKNDMEIKKKLQNSSIFKFVLERIKNIEFFLIQGIRTHS